MYENVELSLDLKLLFYGHWGPGAYYESQWAFCLNFERSFRDTFRSVSNVRRNAFESDISQY